MLQTEDEFDPEISRREFVRDGVVVVVAATGLVLKTSSELLNIYNDYDIISRNMKQPNYEDFRYKGSNDTDAIKATIANRVLTYALTDSGSDTFDQRVATLITTPRQLKSDLVVARLTEFSDDNLRPSGAVFDSLLAESTGCRVIAANLPGVDFYSPEDRQRTQELTPEQIEDLNKGSFVRVGAAVVRAIQNAAIESGIAPKLILLGSSMGASLAAGVAGSDTVDIRGLTMAEPLNVENRSVPNLTMQFAVEPTMGGYAAMNPQILRDNSDPIKKDIQRIITDFSSLYKYSYATGRNMMLNDLGNLDRLENVPVYLTRGAASTLSPESGFRPVVEKFSKVANVESKVFGDVVTNPHNHPYCLTVQSYIDAVESVLARQ